jgi:uncharacterized protein YxjI
MDELLNRNLFLVKEHTGIMKAANHYDMYDPESGNIVLECREEGLGGFTKVLRFTKMKPNTPFDIRLRTRDGRQLVRVSRGWTFWRSHVSVHNHEDQLVGRFRQRLLSIGGKFDVHGPDDQLLCTLRGKWTGWEFKFVSGETEFASVTKRWAGLGKELFTTADNYMLSISEAVPADHPLRPLILAAVVSIDMVLKERSG